MAKQETEVVVYAGEQDDADFPSYDWTLPQLIEWLQAKLAQVPERYWGECTAHISSTTSYDSSIAELKIAYWREETDEECAAREAEQAKQAQRQEQIDRAEYEKLKQRFGGPQNQSDTLSDSQANKHE